MENKNTLFDLSLFGEHKIQVMRADDCVTELTLTDGYVTSEIMPGSAVFGQFSYNSVHSFSFRDSVPYPTFLGVLARRGRPKWSELHKRLTSEYGSGYSIVLEVAITRSRSTGDKIWLKYPFENLQYKDVFREGDITL